MQVTETHTEGLKREYKVLISAEDIDEKMAGRLQELGTRVSVPGFRPGKVPLNILKRRFGKSVMGEVLERAVNDSSSQAINERGLRPATPPKIEITSFDEGKDLEYTMALEILPEIEPMDFSGLELERLAIAVEESAVEETLSDLAKAHKRTKPLDQPRKAQLGDVLVLDFTGTVDGEEFPGMSAEDHHLELGSNSFVQGFEDQLVGAEIGDTREVKLTFPETYVNDRLAGRDAVFTVKIKNILEPAPVPIDDELAATLGETDLAALKERVRERLAGEYRDVARGRLKRQLLDKLAEAHDFPVPEGMVDAEFDTIWRQIEEDRREGRLDPEDAAKSEDELKQEYRTIAERRVRLGLLISEVGRRNGIEVSQDELNRAVLREAQRHPGHERTVFELYQRAPEAMANLRAPIFEDKVVDFIVDLAKVTERNVTPAELRAEMAAEADEAAQSEAKPAESAAKGGKGKNADEGAGRTGKSGGRKGAADTQS
ncbi:MAG: trigger factor [Kiloniellaceae bacterium]